MDLLFSKIFMDCLKSGTSLPITTEEYLETSEVFIRREERFQQALNELHSDLNEQYEQLMTLKQDMCFMEQEATFQYGLSLGLLLMAEALQYNLNSPPPP